MLSEIGLERGTAGGGAVEDSEEPGVTKYSSQRSLSDRFSQENIIHLVLVSQEQAYMVKQPNPSSR